jgi:hypothetical protein
VTLLEARDRIGGRCARATLADVDVDLGAEFSHVRTAVLDLCADAGIEARALYSFDEEAALALRPRLWLNGSLVDMHSTQDPTARACVQLYEELLQDARYAEPSEDDPRAGDRAARSTGARMGNSSPIERDCSFLTLAIERGLPPSMVGAIDAMLAVEYSTDLADLGVREWRRRVDVLSQRENSPTDFACSVSLRARSTVSPRHAAPPLACGAGGGAGGPCDR